MSNQPICPESSIDGSLIFPNTVVEFGPQGPQGVQGLIGPQGVQGSQGVQGTQGVQGFQGIQGSKGDIGQQGFQGPQGFQGTTGAQGVQGPTGPQGVQGAQGTQGFQGNQGTQGFQGFQGSQGPGVGAQGPQGVQGPQGFQGNQGATGVQGVQGPTGPQGVQGAQGFQGPTGPQGVQGAQGNTGAQGIQGPTGPQGNQGAQGPGIPISRTISTTAPLSGGGDLSANRTLSLTQSSTLTDGYLSSTDWNTFNGKIGGTGTASYIPLLSATNTITNSDFYVQNFDGGTPFRVRGYYIDYINGVSPVNLFMGYNGIDIDGNAIYKTSIGENGLSTTGDIYSASTIGCLGNISSGGVLSSSSLSTGSISMTGAFSSISGAYNITGSNKLQIANIGASGTLNVGSTTTATKMVELTTANNTSGAQNNTLRFTNNNTTIATGEQIGRIEFYSGDASSPGASAKAYISCSATSATPNAYIDLATDTTTGTPTVRQRILADGKVLIGSTSDNTSTNRVQISGGLDYNIETATYSSSSSLLLAHKGRFVSTTSATAINITIQPNSTVAFPVGSQVWIVQEGAGVPTIVAGTGVTLLTRSSSKQPFAQYSEIKLTKTATDTWYLTGDLKA